MLKIKDLKPGWYVVGKARNDLRAGKATTRLAQFKTPEAASIYIQQRADRSPKDAREVAAGLYSIDGPIRSA